MQYLVSVITSLYNYSNFIGDAIKSFMKQDFTSSEMVIVDDGSTDQPMKTIKDLLNERVRYICLDRNYGYSKAKNEGIKQSRSEILVMLDADDMLTKKGISTRYNEIVKGFDFIYGPVLDFKNSKIIGRSKMWSSWEKTKKWKYVHAQGVMLKKQIHREIGLYDESLWCKSDREMFARIFNYKYKIGTVNENVAIYRIHSKQMHKSKRKLKINKKLQNIVQRKIKKREKDLSDVEML